MKRKTKILAFILSLMMIFSVMPLSLFASDAQTASTDTKATDVLEALASQHTGTLSNNGNSKVTWIWNDGYFDGSNSRVNDYKTYDIVNFSGKTFTFTPRADDKSHMAGASDCVVFSLTVKRGEAMPKDFVIMSSQLAASNVSWKVTYDGAGNVKFGGSNSGTATIPFPDDAFTNFTAVYNNTTRKAYLYVNGILCDTFGKGEWAASTENRAVATGTINTNGNVMTVEHVSYFYLPAANLDAVIGAQNVANGVFNINGSYYYFECGVPVINRTVNVNDFALTTDSTGKITKCEKDDITDYERWSTSKLQAEVGNKLLWASYLAKFNQRSSDINGYTYEEHKDENGQTYYIVSPTKTLIMYAQAQGTDVGDGWEFTKLTYTEDKYYKAIPDGATEVKDASGNIIGYKTTTAPISIGNQDISYYHEFLNNTTYTTDRTNINIRLKVGEGYKDYLASTADFVLVRFRYYINNTGSGSSGRKEANLGTIKEIDGAPHLIIENVDCGILRSDVYTDLTISTYLKDGAYVYDLYVNGVLLEEALVLQGSGVNNYKPLMVGTYMTTFAHFGSPLLTWGETQVYTGTKVNNNENPYNGTKMTADGVYTYTNGIATALNKGTAIDSTVGLKSYSVTLGETLGINFFAALPQNAAKAVISVGNDTQEIDLTKLTKEANGFYKFTAKISSINVAEQVLVAFYDTDGNLMPVYASNGALYEGAYDCSVKGYATYIAERARIYGDATVELVKAMLNYAAYAEKYFGKNDTLSTAYSASDAAKVTALDAAKVSGVISADGADTSILKSIQLVLDNATKIRINLNSAATVESEYANVKYVEIDGRYYIDICDIDAKNLDTVYTLTVNGIAIEINVVGVASIVAGAPNIYGTDFANLMKAIYLYSEAANAVA